MTAHDLPEHPVPPLRAEPWTAPAAQVLRLPEPELRRRAATASFVALGGTSLRAIELAALAERRLGLAPEVGALLGPLPLAQVLATAAPVRSSPDPADDPVDDGAVTDVPRAASVGEYSMLLSDQAHPSTAHHLLFSAEVRGLLDERRLAGAITALAARHEALRTVFLDQDGRTAARVLPDWRPALIRQELRPAEGSDPVAAVHAVVGPAGRDLLRPFDRPAAAFVLTGLGPGHYVLSLLVHHALVDGWSVGLLWRDLVAAYRGDLPTGRAPSPRTAVREEDSERARAALAARLPELAGAPTTIELPSDLARPRVADRRGARLGFALGPGAMAAAQVLGRATGLTRNTLLLAAWSFVLGRRAGIPDLLIGMASASRTGAAHDVVGLLTRIQPVRCRPEPTSTVREFLDRVGADIRRALDTGAVPSERIVSAMGAGGDPRRNPLTQFAFAAHDELVPGTLTAGEVTFDLHEGHCGGSVFDAVLYVQQWSAERSVLALEYATSVLGFADATALATELDAVLVEFAIDLDAPLATVGDPSTPARTARERLAAGPPPPDRTGLWQLFEQACRTHPDAVAVADAGADAAGDLRLTYRQLHRAAEQQSAVLAAAGVGVGDHVVLAHGRSTQELVSVLATLRLGAAYVGLDEGAPDAVARRVMSAVAPKALLGDTRRLAPLGADSAPLVDPWEPGDAEAVPAAAADPDRIAYIAFTSGSTGVPKGVRVPHRGVTRLVTGPGVLEPGAAERFLRFAPLAFDASTLEIFAPLTTGGTVEIHSAPHLVPSAFRDFVRGRGITGLWLTAGLFRLVADHEPAAFRGVRQVLTGGDVVPPAQVRRALEAAPGLVVTNGYGPTENTTFTTVHHVRDRVEVEDPLPIGRPVPGTSVAVVDEHGRPVPPGAVGELHTAGDGLAADYLDAPDATARAFVTGPDGRRHYRTGDLVRWDGAGRLRYLGRRDNQVKVRGFRVELDGIAHVLREHPDVRDAVVVPTPGAGERLLVAAVVADDSPRLLAALAAHAGRLLPGYAVPTLWTVVGELPLTPNGKVDTAVLAAAGVPLAADVHDPGPAPVSDSGSAPTPVLALVPDPVLDPDEIADEIGAVWEEVLGTDDFGYDERFFDVGGDSLQLTRVRNGLLRALPWCDVTVLDLLTHTTVDALAAYLADRHGERA
ncbi:amino acid adenylation domain-containing protein [Kitasatospora sp. NPDC094019]|uniref:non-ribosomal peptide synthetase n=1 Tax=Kitasatospora sp. NPDC094019 TaxID=3364091 RepID=UPI0037F9A09F